MRTHSIMILFQLKKYFWVLLIPLVRTILALGFDVIGAFSGAYIDVILMCLLLGNATLKWYYCSFKVDTEGNIKLSLGWIFHREVLINNKDISTIILARNPLHTIFHATKLLIYTKGSSSEKSAIKLYLKNNQAAEIRNIYFSQRVSSEKLPNWYSVIIFALLSSSGLGGVLFLGALISGLGIVAGRQLSDEIFQNIDALSKQFALGIPPVAVGLALVIFAGWFASFLLNIGSLLRFRSGRTSKSIVIKCGIFKKSHIYISRSNLCFIDSRKTLLAILAQSSALYISSAGYGSGKNSVNLLYPFARDYNCRLAVQLLANNLFPAKLCLTAHKSTLRRFIFVPSVILGVIVGLIIIAEILQISGMLIFLLEMLPIPIIWWGLVRWVAFYANGIGVSDSKLTIKYIHRTIFHTVTLRKSSVGIFEIKTNPFQRKKGICDMVLHPIGKAKSGSGKMKIRNLQQNELEKLFQK